MRSFLKIFSALLLFLATSLSAEAQFDEGNKYVETSLLTDLSSIIQENDSDTPVIRLGILFKIKPDWHIYWRNSGESAIPTKIQWNVPSGWKVTELNWPAPFHFLERGEINTYGYKDEVLLTAELTAPAEIPSTRELIKIEALISFLVCHDVCVPGKKSLTIEVPFGPEETQGTTQHFDKFQNYFSQTPQAGAKIKEKLLSKTTFSYDNNDNSLLVDLNLNREQFLGLEDLPGLLQLFPYDNSTFKFISASLVNNPSRLAIRAKYKLEGKQDSSLSGIIVLDGKQFPSLSPAGPTSLEWKTEVIKVRAISTLPSEPGRIEESKVEPLRYRFLSYKTAVSKKAAQSVAPQEADSLLIALLFGFLAGVVLNFMPCVLPIISIKVMSFISHADRPRSYILASAAAYSAGILATFLALALSIVSLRGLGMQLGWGFQFQYPQFVIALSVIVFVLALGFFDLFHFTIPYLQRANRGVSKLGEGHGRTFFDGMLATLLSTPCTAPFLGTALAFSFSAPPAAVITVFLSIGLGLASPYVILSLNKKLVSLLPKPGDWMYRMRELMGFLLLLTVIWLLYVLSKLTEDGVTWLLVILLLIFVGFWFSSKAKEAKRPLIKLLFLALIALGTVELWPRLTAKVGQNVDSASAISWIAYSPSVVADQVSKGETVFIDFTAEWCVTCKANEKLVIASTDVVKAIKELKVVPVKADWTTGDPTISKALSNYGGNGVPLYVVVSKHKEIVLSTLLTPSILINAFNEAQQSEQ